jgi:hypothetical protein
MVVWVLAPRTEDPPHQRDLVVATNVSPDEWHNPIRNRKSVRDEQQTCFNGARTPKGVCAMQDFLYSSPLHSEWPNPGAYEVRFALAVTGLQRTGRIGWCRVGSVAGPLLISRSDKITYWQMRDRIRSDSPMKLLASLSDLASKWCAVADRSRTSKTLCATPFGKLNAMTRKSKGKLWSSRYIRRWLDRSLKTLYLPSVFGRDGFHDEKVDTVLSAGGGGWHQRQDNQ